jgi:transposase
MRHEYWRPSRWTYTYGAPGRPPLESSLRELIVRLAEKNRHWGYKRIVGELKGLGVAVSATSVRKVLFEEGLRYDKRATLALCRLGSAFGSS